MQKPKQSLIKRLAVFVWLLAIAIYLGRAALGFSGVTKLAQLYVDVVGVLCWVMCFSRFAQYPKCVQRVLLSSSCFLVLNLVYWQLSPSSYFAYYEIFENVRTVDQIKVLSFSILNIYAAFYFCNAKLLKKEAVQIFFIIATCLFVASYFAYAAFLKDLNDAENVVNNLGYLIWAVAPVAFFVPRKVRYVYLAIALLLGLMSAKRGAAFLGVLMSLVFIYKDLRWYKGGKRLIFVGVVAFAIAALMSYFAEDLQYLQMRFEQVGVQSEGRDVIKENILANWSGYHDLGVLFFGEGLLASIKLAGNYAHNDWLEILVSMGLLGIFVLLFMLIGLWQLRMSLPKRSYLKDAIDVALIYYLSRTLISMSVYSVDSAICMLVFGVCAFYVVETYERKNLVVY